MLSFEKKLVGEKVEGLPKQLEQNANAEVEDKEYIKYNDQSISEVEGKTHEKGGEKMLLDSGTQILSDNLTLGEDLAKELKKDYDIKVSAKDTYAKALKLYTKKLGLDDLNEQMEKQIEKLTKVQKIKDKTTNFLNTSIISKKINEIQMEKEPLEESRRVLYDVLFTEQEVSKSEQEESTEEYEHGGTHVNISKEGRIDQEAGVAFNNTENTPSGAKARLLTKLQNYREALKYDVDLGGLTNEAIDDFEQQVKNYKGDLRQPNELVLSIQKSIPKELALDFSSRTMITNKGLDWVKNQSPEFKTEVEKTLKESGDLPKNFKWDDLTGTRNKYGEQFLRSVNKATSKVAEKEGRTEDYLTSNFYDGRFDVRLLDIYFKDFEKKEDYDNFTNYGHSFKDSKGTLYGNEDGVYVASRIIEPKETPPAVVEEKPPVEKPDPSKGVRNVLQQVQNSLLNGRLMPPAQDILPPTPLQPHLKQRHRFDRIEPINITDQIVRNEANRIQDFTDKQIDEYPDAARRATLLQNNANVQDNLNKAVVQIAQSNAVNKYNADAFNINQNDKEELYRNTDNSAYEGKIYRAMNTTRRDLENYYDFYRRLGLQEYNEQKQADLLNQMFEATNFGSAGVTADQATMEAAKEYLIEEQNKIAARNTTEVEEKKDGGTIEDIARMYSKMKIKLK